MKYVFTFLLFVFSSTVIKAQVLPSSRSVDWSATGSDTIISYPLVVSVTSFGAIADGTTPCDSAFSKALISLKGNGGVILFDSGSYFFRKPIIMRDSLVIRGNGSDHTTLLFDIGGAEQDLIAAQGAETELAGITVTSGVEKGSKQIVLNDALTLPAFGYYRIVEEDTSLTISSWAFGSVAQIVRGYPLNQTILTIDDPLRRTFTRPKLFITEPISGVGIECVKIIRRDSTTGQTSNINFDHALNSWIKGVESEKTNFAHIALSYCSNISVMGCYIHDSWGYGGGGRGYGVAVQYSSGKCLIENNIFRHVRHSVLLQSGANGNVIAYNYSRDPYWAEQVLPANSAGDIVLHGNYPFANLFEGNICQNIVVDNSHGINGPHNTFFRNRAELYGIVMNSSPASDGQNFIGNEISNTAPLMGNYILSGSDRFEYGNNVKGTIMPSSTANLPDISYYRSKKPSFFPNSIFFPPIGTPNTISKGTIPAQLRYAESQFTDCSFYPDTLTSSVRSDKTTIYTIYPNPATEVLKIDDTASKNYIIYDILGRVICNVRSINGTIDISMLQIGEYFLSGKDTRTKKIRFIKQ